MTLFSRFIWLILWVLSPFFALAQWSELVYYPFYHQSDELNNYSRYTIPTADGGWFSSGSVDIDYESRYLFTRLDANGRVRWQRMHPLPGFWYANQAVEDADGTFTVAGRLEKQGTRHLYLTRLNANGVVLWNRLVDSLYNYLVFKMMPAPDQGHVIVAYPYGTQGYRVIKTDAEGQVQSLFIPSVPGANDLQEFTILPDGNYRLVMMSGYDLKLFVIEYAPDGTLLDVVEKPTTENFLKTTLLPDGNYLTCGWAINPNRLRFYKFDPQGNITFQKEISLGSIATLSIPDITVLEDGSFALTFAKVSNVFDPFLYSLDYYSADCNLLWSKPIAPMSPASLTHRGDHLLVTALGKLADNDIETVFQCFDLEGNDRRHWLEGFVVQDVNANCQTDNEPGLAGRLIQIANGSDTLYASTNPAGYYRVAVNAGTYQVKTFSSNDLWAECMSQVNIQIPSTLYSFTTRNFALKANAICPRLNVELATPRLRRCFPGRYDVRICNEGSAPADPASVMLVLDPYLLFDSASMTLSGQSGDSLLFDIGPLAVDDCRTFNVWFRVDCDSTVLGQTHCSRAFAYPDSLCTTVGNGWSGASLDIGGRCAGDSVRFTVRNAGLFAMDSSQIWLLYENDSLVVADTFLLGADTTFELAFPANGNTWRLETTQVPGHPFAGRVQAVVEGCVTGGGQDFVTGFVTLFNTEDASPFVAADCQDNTGAYDPNDKTAFPSGRGPMHAIRPGEPLEYRIRFQNTGTDTAFTVIIRDTLSPALDISSVRPGPSSHPYRFDVHEGRVLEFTFNNILLPDSNVNIDASQGYVMFSANQNSQNQEFTVISNRAAIFFDYNQPVITNDEVRIVQSEEIPVTQVYSPDNGQTFDLRVYPNPARDFLVLDGGNTRLYRAILYRTDGQIVRDYDLPGNVTATLSTGNLPSGVYFLRAVNTENVSKTMIVYMM